MGQQPVCLFAKSGGCRAFTETLKLLFYPSSGFSGNTIILNLRTSEVSDLFISSQFFGQRPRSPCWTGLVGAFVPLAPPLCPSHTD